MRACSAAVFRPCYLAVAGCVWSVIVVWLAIGCCCCAGLSPAKAVHAVNSSGRSPAWTSCGEGCGVEHLTKALLVLRDLSKERGFLRLPCGMVLEGPGPRQSRNEGCVCAALCE